MQSSAFERSLATLTTFYTRHQQKAASTVLIVLLVYIAWLLGQSVWLFFSPSTSLPKWMPPKVSEQKAKAVISPIDEIVQANLFGSYQQKAPVEEPKSIDAPKTRLNVTLVGVVSSSDPEKSLAVIANKGAQETLGVNELISGTRAKLISVLPDRIIIDNGGRDEVLMLEGAESQSATRSSKNESKPKSDVKVSSSINMGDIEQIKKEILENPQQFLRYIRLSQVNKDGELLGYRVRPGRESALFDSVGLKNGDLAVELNGVDLTNKSAMGELMKNFNDMTEVSLTVERDGQRHDIYIQF